MAHHSADTNADGQQVPVPQSSGDPDARVERFGDLQAGRGRLFHGDPSSSRYDELYVDDKNQIVGVISVNPPPDLSETLEQLTRVKPPVDGLEDEIREADFDLNLLLALD